VHSWSGGMMALYNGGLERGASAVIDVVWSDRDDGGRIEGGVARGGRVGGG